MNKQGVCTTPLKKGRLIMYGRNLKEWDVTDEQFNCLTALYKSEERISGKTTWFFRCKCGSVVAFPLTDVLRGKNKSCGCLRKNNKPFVKKHGLSHTRIYNIWNKMIKRCTDPNNHKFHIYGAKGIRVCDE